MPGLRAEARAAACRRESSEHGSEDHLEKARGTEWLCLFLNLLMVMQTLQHLNRSFSNLPNTMAPLWGKSLHHPCGGDSERHHKRHRLGARRRLHRLLVFTSAGLPPLMDWTCNLYHYWRRCDQPEDLQNKDYAFGFPSSFKRGLAFLSKGVDATD